MINIVFPFYNESLGIPSFKIKMEAYLTTNKYVDAITMVNDGSTDDTIDQLLRLENDWSQKYPHVNIKVININKNQGKGNALKTGVLDSNSEWVITMDADLAYHPSQIDTWVENHEVLNFDHKVFIGSRKLHQSEVKSSVLRNAMSSIFSYYVYLMTKLPFKDTQSGFKMYPTKIAKKVFGKLREKGFAHDVEILMRLSKEDVGIQELPVLCEATIGSSVNVISDSWSMMKAIFRIRKMFKSEK